MATTLTLASFGGTFISGGQPGRKGYFVPMDEDSRYEELFLTCNDPCQPTYLSLDEFAGLNTPLFAGDDEEEDDRDLADRLLDTELSQTQINAAAKVMLDDPQLLVDLCRQAQEYDKELLAYSAQVEKKLGAFVRSVFAAMLTLAPANKINRSLMLRRDPLTEKTLLSCLAQFARTELKRKPCHYVALPIMRSLGHDDVFASYLG